MDWFGSGKEERWEAFQKEAVPIMPQIYRTAVWLTKSQHEAEDLVQETMFQALKSFDRYEPGTNCKAWLSKIMHNLYYKQFAKSRRMQFVDDAEERLAETIAFEPTVPEVLTDREIINALSDLPHAFRAVIVLSDVEEFSYKEISSILNIPMGTVMSRLYRGRRILRQALAEHVKDYGFGRDRSTAVN